MMHTMIELVILALSTCFCLDLLIFKRHKVTPKLGDAFSTLTLPLTQPPTFEQRDGYALAHSPIQVVLEDGCRAGA